MGLKHASLIFALMALAMGAIASTLSVQGTFTWREGQAAFSRSAQGTSSNDVHFTHQLMAVTTTARALPIIDEVTGYGYAWFFNAGTNDIFVGENATNNISLLVKPAEFALLRPGADSLEARTTNGTSALEFVYFDE